MILVDTNVLSELMRPRPSPSVVRWAATVESFALSVVTIEEVEYGLSRRPNRRVAAAYSALVAAATVLPVDAAVARDAGRLRGALAARGLVRSQPDMLIAATAKVHRVPLATRNVRDFEGCSISIVDAFAP